MPHIQSDTEGRCPMTVGQLLRSSSGDRAILIQMLDGEGRAVVESHAMRLLGDIPPGLTDRVLAKALERVFSTEPSCLLPHLLYDCLRGDLLRLLREQAGNISIQHPLLRDYLPDSKPPARRAMQDLLFSLLNGPQRAYLLNRYYFLKEATPPYPKFERAIAALFQGQGAAKHRAQHYRLDARPPSPSRYLDCLDNLDPYYLARLEAVRSDARFRKPASSLPDDVRKQERAARRSRVFFRCLPLILIILVIILLGFAYSRNPFWTKWGHL